MTYQDKYLEYLESVPEVSRRCKETGNRMVLAYTSNLDAIARCDEANFNRLLEKYLKGEPSYVEEEPVETMEDFARVISYFAIHGLGGEVDITSGAVVKELGEYFEMSYAFGGTCAQGAGAIAAMEVPVMVHFTDESEEVITDIKYEGIESVKDGKRVPLKECISGEEPLLHLIMQYSKGDVLRIHGKEYTIPISNRLIMQYDEVHKVMPVKKDFMQYVEDHAEQICSYSVSGFNAILDMDIMKERAMQVKKHYEIVKAKSPGTIIYFESAHFFSTRIRDYLYTELADCVDILGMNEEELIDLTAKMSYPVDRDNMESIIQGLDYILEQYPAKGVVIHSKDYSLYYGAAMEGIDLEKGLTLGNLMSGARARVGHHASMEECRGNLALGLSPTGVDFAERLEHMDTRHTAILVPSRYMEKPRYTVGLGDTFVAGMQMCFVK